jgi:polysaccharide export outer membrane protein
MKLRFSVARLACTGLVLSLASTSFAAKKPKQEPAQQPTVAQTPAPDATPAPQNTPAEPTLTLRDDKALESFEPGLNEEYTLGPGDEISLEFPGRPELTSAGKQTIGPDGRITLPLSGAIHVADLTREGAAKAIVASLATYYNDLTATVRVDKYSSNRVRVMGYVQHPGEILFESTPSLLDAIGRAGLIAPQVTTGGVASNVGSGIPETCTIYRSNNTAVTVNLRELLLSGNNLADMRLRRNDVIYVPQPKENFVSVLGEVGKPGTVPLTPESTLTSVLSQAGCCGEGGGFNPEIHIIQPSTGKVIKVSYNKVMTLAGQKEFTLHSGDVIIVPKTGLFKATWILQRISPVATMVSLAALVGGG